MRILSCFFRLNNYISYFLSRPPPVFVMSLYFSHISGGYFMDYLKRYQKMISLRGLTDHTMKSYQTYISAYLDYIRNTLHKTPSQVSYKEQRRFLEVLQKERNLSDRTINVAISQLRFLPFMFFISHGMTHSFLCENLIPICLLFLQKKKRKPSFLP